MSKHRLSPTPLPIAKRHHGSKPFSERRIVITFDNALYDELILLIFSFLDSRDLCAVEAINRNCSRLAGDNHLWRALFVREFGKARLRGGRGYYGRADGRIAKRLPSRISPLEDDVLDWKWMYRISSNWRNGRCAIENFRECENSRVDSSSLSRVPISLEHLPPRPRWFVLLAGTLTIFAASECSQRPIIFLRNRSDPPMTFKCKSQLSNGPISISSMALDQSPSSSRMTSHGPTVSLAAFLSTGEFSIYDHDPSSAPVAERRTYIPLHHHRSPVTHAAYHHPLLVTLSHAFTLMIYDLSGDTIIHTQTLSSFTSHPPTSVVLSAMPLTSSFKLVLAYAVPVYPSHWSVGATELIISRSGSVTRSARAFDVPQGWIDEQKLQQMRVQWCRKVKRVADTQTDGKWVVLASGDTPPPFSTTSRDSSSSSSQTLETSPSTTPSPSTYVSSPSHSSAHLQLYRLHMPSPASTRPHTHAPRLTFIRTLHGPSGPVSALALADGRCVCLGVHGSIWVWDLESGSGAEVEKSSESADGGVKMETSSGPSCGTVVFDERRIVSAGIKGIEERRFDI
ncbi:hypothetical protein J3A83DRAFT_4358078 [Scleroderma citrinum]